MFSRTPPPSRHKGDRRRGLLYALVGALVVYLALTALGTLWTDYLWFESNGFASVWSKRWAVGLGLGTLGTIVAATVFWLTVYLADRFGPRFFPPDLAEEEELVARFRYWTEGRLGRLRVVVALVLGLFVGAGIAAWRDDLFLFLADRDFGLADPIFSLDAGFFVFQFPLIDMALRWLFNLLATAAVLGAVAHYLNGGIRIRRGSMPAFTFSAKAHLSILLALMALVRAAIYRMDALALLYSDRQDQFFGPGFTDVTARLPALRLLMAIALVAAIVFVVNIWRRGWTLALMAVGGWILVSVAALLVYPAIVDRLQVQPQQLVRESPYIGHNIEFTRVAYNLDEVEIRDFPATRSLGPEQIENNRATVDNLRLWDASVLPRTYQNLQEIRPYYSLEVVDTDRYELDGETTQTMVAVRELDEAAVGTNWQNSRLIYTHGIGAVVSQANRVEEDGQPQFLLSDLPPAESDPALSLTQPRIYFGETYTAGRPVIVNTGNAPQEVDMPVEGERILTSEYDGQAGVELSSIWHRIAFAFRYRDLNLLISGQIRPESRVLVQRNVQAIVSDLAPFLHVDSDPYPVVTDGRVVWILDLYTTSDSFPYSKPVTDPDDRRRLPQSTDLTPGINYMANPVKATIDAYDGTVTFYVTDDSDPLIRAWQETYPRLFRDGSEMPEALQAHLRYPQDMFRVQGEIYLNYHVDQPAEFFTRNDAWSIPDDPASIRRGLFPGAELLLGDSQQVVGGQVEHLRLLLPYYLLTQLPGEDELSYLLLQPFNPRARPNMSSFLVADAPTPGRPSRLIDFRMPQGTLVGGTGQVGDRIQQNDEIAEQFTLWSQQGSTVIRGDILVVPIEDSIMYIQPIYLQSAEQGGFPEFRRVVVVYGDRIEWALSLNEAMAEVFGLEIPDEEAPAPDQPGEEEPPEQVPSTIQDLLDEAAALLEQADEALRAGDLGEYQRLVEEAAQLIEEARRAGGEDVEASIEDLLAGQG